MAANRVTTVLLIRHADRDIPSAGTPDPPLNARGKTRARKLIHVLSTTGIRAVYTSDTTRAIMTAKPYLDAYARRPLPFPMLLLRPSVVRLFDPIEIKNHILTHHAGQTVLVVGHSNTVPELIRQLGGTSLPDIDDCEFDNLFVLVRYSSTKASLTKLKYGAPTSAPC